MDISILLEFIVVLAAIFLGVRLGGIGIGYVGGAGVLVLGLVFGMKPGNVPWDVILIIGSVIAAIAAMQLAGGLDYLVRIAEGILRRNPKQINYLAPVVTYALTLFAGTGHTAFSMIPVIVEVAKEQHIRPCVPLSIAVVASQIAITASPVSAAVIYMSGVLEEFGWSYPLLLGIWIVTTFVACMLTAFVMTLISKMDLDSDPVYMERLAKGLVKAPNAGERPALLPHAKLSVLIFLLGVIFVVLYASAISPAVGIIDPVIVPRDAAIWSVMFIIATLISFCCKIDVSKIGSSSVFQSGMIAVICVFGVAWLGDTFVSNHSNEIKELAAGTVSQYPALLAVVFFIAAMLLYSQAATAKAITPAIVAALGITAANPGDSYMLVASFAAVSALFVLPTYPTLLGAVQMDYTGTTRIGKWVFNHAFFLPGLIAIVFSVVLGFLAVGLF
ncbi:MAG: anaerobic C4-dicarboxylate transporter [Sutterella parvirubra]|jgi:anaerobic C4-dicarboxylate transporter DcuA|uniref:C4-dicarboxylate transporter n=1 Tax=Sutterella parvirubra YIT 11816 TaxID=762967 RepID=H3KI97_9BURK|nr:anaerobic C4-dicarboxylate transporter [Sutterella parvirubra]EHY30144.1 anaerobic C4-dicarboxylate transporter DcuA [Sutterella parvirubra YIT 11816]MCI7709887.1 anaerobic C4-dicarboxylate transporter [Sutterella parvirubra]MDR3770011.1 anaerobic C4-dicarboxylate transporter [Sutterella sp.]MDY5202051.1 anaerobic C4-dicarboxylate transporter [Sutterella parvirubra]